MFASGRHVEFVSMPAIAEEICHILQ